MKTIRDVNKALKRHNVTLYKGRDYLYLTYDTAECFETKSFYVCHFNALSHEAWVKEGVDFANECWVKYNRMSD